MTLPTAMWLEQGTSWYGASCATNCAAQFLGQDSWLVRFTQKKRTQNQFYMLDSSQGKKWYATHSTRWYLKIKLEFEKKDRQKTQQKQLQLVILNKNLLAVDVSETGIQEHTYWPDCYQVTSSTWTKTCPFWRNLSQNWWKTRDCCVTCPALARDEGGVYIPVLATLGEWIGLPYLK